MQLFLDIEPVELKVGELVPRQGVAPGVELRLSAASRGSLDEMDRADFIRLNPPGDQVVRIRGPVGRLVGVAFPSILAELNSLTAFLRANIEIVLMNIGAPFPIRGDVAPGPVAPVALLLPLPPVIQGALVLGSLPGPLELRQLVTL